MNTNLVNDIKIYENYNFSLIPVAHKTKQPTIKWKKYQTTKPTRREMQEWFTRPIQNLNVGVLCGKISDNLTIRDFDTLESYQDWKTNYPDLAETLPTVNTSRGKHVYFKSDFSKIEHIGNSGELRGSGITLIPPSIHPDGTPYTWEIPLNENLIELDPVESGLLPKSSSKQSIQTIQSINRLQQDTTDTNQLIIDSVVMGNIPDCEGIRNKKIFDFAKDLKYIKEFEDKSPYELKSYFDIWFEHALPKIKTKDYEESWMDFIIAFDKVKVLSADLDYLFEVAKTKKAPQKLINHFPENNELHLLCCFCRELQNNAGNEPFFLSVRKGEKYLDVPFQRIGKLLKILVIEGMLKLIKKGGTKSNPKKASRYKYIGD